jgi:non-specific serine/threonine protein kinase/serine/threonine-protein kinase
VQKLLVTRVLDHLDRMANDAQGDRATQLDLVNAYAKLGALQGDAYDQNLGDPDGGLSSVGKALTIAEPLSSAHPEDSEVLHALAVAQVIRSEILFGTGRTPEAIAAMQAGIHTYDRLIAAPNANVNLIADAAAAHATLGDELGQPGTASLGDTAGALAAYRKAIDLDYRIVKIDPTFIRSRRGLAIMQMKIGSAKAESDPAQAHKDFQLAAQLNDALPEEEKSTFNHIRFQSMILRKDAGVLSQLGRYDEAEPLFQQVQQSYEKLSNQDPLDIRALADLQVIYDDQAVAYEDKAEVDLARSSDPRQIAAVQRNRPLNLEKSRQFYKLGTVVLERMLKLDPTNVHWKGELAYAQVKVGELGMELHPSSEAIAWSRKGLATLREMERKGQLSSMMLNNASVIFATVSPENLRDPQLAVTMAKEVISRTDRRDPSKLLSLAWAYRANGQPIQARAAAAEGLALLPPFHAGDRESRLHRELALEANH